MNRIKVILTGSGGQFGRDFIEYMKPNSAYEVIGFDRLSLDINNTDRFHELIKEHRPKIIINAAAMTNLEKCERDSTEAYNTNGYAVGRMAELANMYNMLFVQLSTDYVFNGEDSQCVREGFSESMETNPKSVYAKSKLLGEHLVQEYCKKHLIIRTSWLYGFYNRFFVSIVQQARDKKKIYVVDDQYGSPTSTDELNKHIMKLIDNECIGLYHCCAKGYCSRYEFAKAILDSYGFNCEIVPVPHDYFPSIVERPAFSGLSNTKLEKMGMDEFEPWKEALYKNSTKRKWGE